MACEINTTCIDKIEDGINKITACLYTMTTNLFDPTPNNGNYVELEKALTTLCDIDLSNQQTSSIATKVATDLAKLFHDYMRDKFSRTTFHTNHMKNVMKTRPLNVLSALQTCGWYSNNQIKTKNTLKSRIDSLLQGIYQQVINLCGQVQNSSIDSQCGPIDEPPTCWDILSNWVVYHPCLEEHNLGYKNLANKYIYQPQAMEDGSIKVDLVTIRKFLDNEFTIKDLLCNSILCNSNLSGDSCEGSFLFTISVGGRAWTSKEYYWSSTKEWKKQEPKIKEDMVTEGKAVIKEFINALIHCITTALENRKQFITNINKALNSVGSASSELKTVAILYMMTGDLSAEGLANWPVTFAGGNEICNQLLCFLWNHNERANCGGAPVFDEIAKTALCNTGIMATNGNLEEKDWPVQTIDVPFARVTDKWNFDSDDPKVLNSSAEALLASIDKEIGLGKQCGSAKIINMNKNDQGKVISIVIKFPPSAMWQSGRGSIPTDPTIGGDGKEVPGIPDCNVTASREIMENIVKLLNITRPPTCKKSIFDKIIKDMTPSFTLPPIGGPGVAYTSGENYEEYAELVQRIADAEAAAKEIAERLKLLPETEENELNRAALAGKLEEANNIISGLKSELNDKFGQRFCTYTWPNETVSGVTTRFGDDVMPTDCKVYPIVFEHWERLRLVRDIHIFSVIASRVFTATNTRAEADLKSITTITNAMMELLTQCGIENTKIPIMDTFGKISDKVFDIDSCNIIPK